MSGERSKVIAETLIGWVSNLQGELSELEGALEEYEQDLGGSIVSQHSRGIGHLYLMCMLTYCRSSLPLDYEGINSQVGQPSKVF